MPLAFTQEDFLVFKCFPWFYNYFFFFLDVTSATRALNTVNGYNFKGKPIIIQYGRNKE